MSFIIYKTNTYFREFLGTSVTNGLSKVLFSLYLLILFNSYLDQI